MRQRRASRLDFPSACFRSRNSRAGGWTRPWQTAIRRRAQLSCRLPPRSPGELGVACKAGRARGLGHELGGDQRAAAFELQQLGRPAGDQSCDLAFELFGPANATANLDHQLAGNPHASALLDAGQLASEAIEPAGPVKASRRQLQLGPEVVQVPAQPLLVCGAGLDNVLAVVERGPRAERPWRLRGRRSDPTCRRCARRGGFGPSASGGP